MTDIENIIDSPNVAFFVRTTSIYVDKRRRANVIPARRARVLRGGRGENPNAFVESMYKRCTSVWLFYLFLCIIRTGIVTDASVVSYSRNGTAKRSSDGVSADSVGITTGNDGTSCVLIRLPCDNAIGVDRLTTNGPCERNRRTDGTRSSIDDRGGRGEAMPRAQ